MNTSIFALNPDRYHPPAAAMIAAFMSFNWPGLRTLSYDPHNCRLLTAASIDPAYELLAGAHVFENLSEITLDRVEFSYLDYRMTFFPWASAASLIAIAPTTVKMVRDYYEHAALEMMFRRPIKIIYNPDPPFAPDECDDEDTSPACHPEGTPAVTV